MYPAPYCRRTWYRTIYPFEYAKEWYIKNVYQVVLKNNPKLRKSAFGCLCPFITSMTHLGVKLEYFHESLAIWYCTMKAERRELLDVCTYSTLIDGIRLIYASNFSSGGIHGAENFYRAIM